VFPFKSDPGYRVKKDAFNSLLCNRCANAKKPVYSMDIQNGGIKNRQNFPLGLNKITSFFLKVIRSAPSSSDMLPGWRPVCRGGASWRQTLDGQVGWWANSA
jgi:hypothetical protein